MQQDTVKYLYKACQLRRNIMYKNKIGMLSTAIHLYVFFQDVSRVTFDPTV